MWKDNRKIIIEKFELNNFNINRVYVKEKYQLYRQSCTKKW